MLIIGIEISSGIPNVYKLYQHFIAFNVWFIVPLLIRFDNIVETNVSTIVIVIKNTNVTFDIYSYQHLLSLISHLFLVNEKF
jgi:hypothetical protein